MKLDTESTKTLAARRSRGRTLVGTAWGQKWDEMHPDDRQSAATDAISDILTALLGPAGYATLGEPNSDGESHRVKTVHFAPLVATARNLLDAALRSYEGDAEDYFNDERAAQ